ncbi:MAG: PKD domain-containing protein [Bacteroidetes bacterium]|nr:PKD domain-containing protein [Bacteroidota bacterium]
MRMKLLFAITGILMTLGISAQNVSFDTDVSNGCSPLTVNCENTSSIDTTKVTFNWFVNGQYVYTGWELQYIFDFANYYQIRLEARDSLSNGIGEDYRYVSVSGGMEDFWLSDGHQICSGSTFQTTVNGQAWDVSWDFGDGTNTSQWSPTHSYAADGTYIIQLDFNSGSCGWYGVTDTVYVSSSALPEVQINTMSGRGEYCPNDDITFSDRFDAKLYLWSFGDGTYSTQSEPEHAYSATGNYDVILTVTNDCGQSNSDTFHLEISNGLDAQADFGAYPNEICPNSQFHCYTSQPGSIHWDLGDGNTSTESEFYYSYPDTGHYQVTFSITNGCGDQDTGTSTVYVRLDPNSTPFIQVGFMNTNGPPSDTMITCVGGTAEMRAWTDNCDSVKWYFSDGGTDSGYDVEHSFSTPGWNTITVIGTNSCGGADTVIKWVYADSTIQSEANLQALPMAICPGESVFFFDNNMDWGGSTYYSIWFGDGDSLVNVNTTTHDLGVLAEHVYDQAGSYDFIFVADGECGNPDTLAGTVVVDGAMTGSHFYMVMNSTNESQGQTAQFPDWGTTPTGPYMTLNMPITFADWVPGMNDTFYVAFWYGGIDIFSGGDPGEPDGIITREGLGTTTAYIPAEDDSVAVLGIWYCDGQLGDQFDAFGTIGAIPIIPGFTLNIPAPGLQLGNWDGTCEEEVNSDAACPGDTIEFIALGGVEYEWFFGDGASTTDNPAQHAYADTGNFAAFVVITNGCGDIDTIGSTAYVHTYNPPDYADFNYYSSSNCPGSPIYFQYNDNPDGYEFLWDFGDGTTSTEEMPMHIFATGGQHTVTLTVTNGCGSYSDSRDIYLNNFNFTVESFNGCYGLNNGSINIDVTDANYPVSIQWSTGATSFNLNNLAPGVYGYYIQDGGGCAAFDSVEIEAVTELQAFASFTSPACQGDANGTATVTVMGGTAPFNYIWSTSSANDTIFNLSAGTYYLTVIDASGCSTTEDVTIDDPTVVAVNFVVSDAHCNGEASGSILATASGGTWTYNYLWSDNSTNAYLNNVAAGIYTITVTDGNGCTVSKTDTISEPTALDIVSADLTHPICANGNTGAITVHATGGTLSYDFIWSSGATDSTATTLFAGTHTVSITDGQSCVYTESFVLADQFNPFVITMDKVNAACGISDGKAWVVSVTDGGNTPYTYSWSTSPTQTTDTAFAVGAGVYTVIVSSAEGCSDSASVIVGNTNAPIVDSVYTSMVSCNGVCDGEAIIYVSAGTPSYTYSWSVPATDSIATALCSGRTWVTVTDAATCKLIQYVDITQPALLQVTIADSASVSCFGDDDAYVNLTITGGVGPFEALWSNGDTTLNLTDVGPDTYSVVITDAHACTQPLNGIILYEPDTIGITLTPHNLLCAASGQGSIEAAIVGGTGDYTILWTNGDTVADISGLDAATYTITVTDENGCSAQSAVTLTEPDTLEVAYVTVLADCHGDDDASITATPSGGTAPYIYYWSNFDTDSIADGLAAGPIQVTITDANGCELNNSFTISEPDALTTSMNAGALDCYGDADASVLVYPVGGTTPYSYNWSVAFNDSIISNVGAGEYFVTVTDDNGCTKLDSATITEPDAIEIILTPDHISCNGMVNGSISANVTGGTPTLIYDWSNGDDLATIYNLDADTYTLTVTDGNGCEDTASVTITEPDSLLVVATVTDATSSTASDGIISLAITGGTPIYDIIWSNSDTTATITGLPYGDYTYIVTDANGCTVEDSVYVDFDTRVKLISSGAKISVYPVPANDFLHVETEGSMLGDNLNLYDLQGKLVRRMDVTGLSTARLNISDIPAGTYMLSITEHGVVKGQALVVIQR